MNVRERTGLFLVVAVCTYVVSFLIATTSVATELRDDPAIEAFKSEYTEDAFEAVSSRVRFEPYSGNQRGALGAALSGSGNALDQALLLAAVLDGQVADWRIATGKLDEDSISHLMTRNSPSYQGGQPIDSGKHTVYDPINDKSLRKRVRDHYWLEVKEDEASEWVSLDPTFPDIQYGGSATKAKRRFKKVPSRLQQKLTFRFMQTLNSGQTRQLGKITGSVAEFSRFPIALAVRGVPQYAPSKTDDSDSQNSTPSNNAGGLLGGGAFGGGKSNKASPSDDKKSKGDGTPKQRQVVGTEYRRELIYAGKEAIALKNTFVNHADSSTQLAREWVEITVTIPGQRPQKLNRELFTNTSSQVEPAAMRRYSFSIIAGEMTGVAFDAARESLSVESVDSARRALETLKNGPADNDTAIELMQIESSLALSPHLINLAFAYESDVLTNRLAARAGVRVIRDIPRILITSVESGKDKAGDVTTSTTLDLRLDEVSAVPLSGWPIGASELFLRSRGIQESALEGRVLARFVEQPQKIVTTELLMREAQKQGRQLIAVTQKNKTPLEKLQDLPDAVRDRIDRTLVAGHQVIIPSGATSLNGQEMWGWWDVNPSTGSYIGVMQSGQHQAMVQYTVTLEKVGVNDAMGYVIGALVGSTATLTLYSAKMIEYGAVTPQLIQEVAAGIEQLTCVTCPSFQVSVSPISGSAGFSSQCFESVGVGFDTAVGVSGSISFCENYKLAISCAASLMLGTFEIEENVSLGPDATLDLGPLSCD